MKSSMLLAIRARGPALLALLALGSLLTCDREHSSPFEPVEDTRPGHLSLMVGIPCGTVSVATVFLDGRADGEMKIPGGFYVDVPVGLHTFQIGAYSYVISFQVDHGETATFTNGSFVCPQTTP